MSKRHRWIILLLMLCTGLSSCWKQSVQTRIKEAEAEAAELRLTRIKEAEAEAAEIRLKALKDAQADKEKR